MTLFKRGTVWWAYFTMGGVRHERSSGTTNRKRAERILSKLKEEAKLNRFRITELDPDITFQSIADEFLASGPSFFNRDRLKTSFLFSGSWGHRKSQKQNDGVPNST